MKRLLFLLTLFVCMFGTAKAHAQAVACSSAGHNITSIACSPTLSAGDAAIFDVSVYSGNPATPSGCGTWYPLGSDPTPGGTHAEYFLQNYAGGSCTATMAATGTGPSTCISATITKFSGLPPNYSLYFWHNQQIGSTGSPSTVSAVLPPGANDIMYTSFAGSPGGSSGFGSASCSAGYTGTATFDTDGLSAVATCSKAGLGPGTQSNTFSWSVSSAVESFVALLRPALPTFGPIQAIDCPASSSPVTCSPLFPITTGDNIKVTVPCPQLDYTLTNSSTPNPGYILPGISYWVDTWLFENIGSSQPTFSVTYSDCGENPNVIVSEWVGESNTSAYADGATNFDDLCAYEDRCTNTSFSSTPIHVLSAGQYDLYAVVSRVSEQVITPSSGFVPLIIDQAGSSTVNAIYYQLVTPSSATSYTNIPSWVTGVPASNIGLWAFSNAPYVFPHVLQTTALGGGIGGASFLNSMHAGSTVVFNASVTASPGDSTWSATNTCGGTQTLVRGGGPTDMYATWAINGLTGGSPCAVVPVYGTTPLFLNAAEVYPVTAIQSGNSETGTDITVNTGSVTTTNSTTALISWCVTGFGEYTSVCAVADTTWTQTQQLSGDNGGDSMYTKTVLAPGTWDNNGMQSITGTTANAGIIVPLTLTLPPVTNVQPNVTVISQNNADILHDFRMYAGR